MRILLVEDDNRIAAFVAKGLRENSYAVDTAIDGDEATYMASITVMTFSFLTSICLRRTASRFALNFGKMEICSLF